MYVFLCTLVKVHKKSLAIRILLEIVMCVMMIVANLDFMGYKILENENIIYSAGEVFGAVANVPMNDPKK